MTVPTITNKQKQIITYLYTYRFLTLFHFQQLFNHKDTHRIKEWLKDLLDKKYVARTKLVDDITYPYIYCLAQRARYILKENEDYEETILNKLYKEKSLTKNFISHHLAIADIYLYFLTQQEKDTELDFFTKQELLGYDYFPKELPDAYISTSEDKEVTRYFLDLFDEYTPLWAIRKRIKDYIQYHEDSTWQENAEDSPFPTILYVLPNQRVLKHIQHFTKAVFEKTFYDDISIYLTTKDKLKGNGQDIWEKVE